jgi:precorrin-6Y C5,15-methyltransferase (decarboxylating)
MRWWPVASRVADRDRDRDRDRLPHRWPVAVVGLLGGVPYGADAQAALVDAEVLVGTGRHLEAVGNPEAERLPFDGTLAALLDTLTARIAAGRRVCVLASGDPGFFGIVRALSERFGPTALTVHPAPSSVALAFARLGVPWDDAAVVSAHGRDLAEAVALVGAHPKVAMLVSPENPPEAVAKALLEAGGEEREVAVCSNLAAADEVIVRTDLAGLAAGTWDPLSVVVLWTGGLVAEQAGLSWGLPEERFAHRAGMITKAEVRAIALGKLDLPQRGVLWDVGAGSGSVAVECARLAPGLQVVAIERDQRDSERIRANAAAHRVAVEVVVGEAPAALTGLPNPDRVFVGGGGLDVLDATLARLRPGGTVVATYAALDRAAEGWGRLGSLVQVAISRGEQIGRHQSVRLAAENPVFVCWGPS